MNENTLKALMMTILWSSPLFPAHEGESIEDFTTRVCGLVDIILARCGLNKPAAQPAPAVGSLVSESALAGFNLRAAREAYACLKTWVHIGETAKCSSQGEASHQLHVLRQSLAELGIDLG